MCAAQLAWQSRKRDIDEFINGIPIRKVYFAPALPQIAEHIKPYFQRFGVVESISMHDKRRSKFGFIQYSTVEAAKAALSNPEHSIANKTLTVKPAHELHQPDYMKFRAPEQDSQRHILNALNDDCLERVFKQLNLIDLAIAADVCIRFQRHAIDAFKSKYKHVINTKVIKFWDRFEYTRFIDDIIAQVFEMIFRNFGSLIYSLTIDGNTLFGNTTDILEMVSKYAPALKHLKLDRFEAKGGVNNARPLFTKLKSLELIDYDGLPSDLLASCSELKSLHIGDTSWEDYDIDQTFPKLEHVYLDVYSALTDTELEKFITSNPTIKKLSIRNIRSSWHSSCTGNISVIGRHLKNLTELEFYQDGYYFKNWEFFQGLSQLSSLKKLTLNCNGISMTALLNELVENAVPLEYLSLEIGLVDSSAIRTMCKLTKLKEIELEDIRGLTDDHLIELAKGLPQLRALHLDGSTAEHITVAGLRSLLGHAKMLSYLTLEEATNIHSISIHDYRSMLKSVQDRSEKIKLKIRIPCDGSKVNVPEDVLSANRDLLWIDEEVVKDVDGEDDDDKGSNDSHREMMYKCLYL